MDHAAFEHHLTSPQGRGARHEFAAEAGGYACGDRIGLSLGTDGRRVTGAGFTASGCGAATAAASAAVALVRGRGLLDAARIGTPAIAAELGGLSPGKLHAAELAADALARALGQAARRRAALPGHDRTLVAMSGGVDSSVAAVLCGEPVAVTLELWADTEHDAERSCCSASAVAQARAMAHALKLPHFTLDLRDEFRAGVVRPFIAAHAAGKTPNPCVGCNGHVRLDAMLDLAERLGCPALATGHYARVAWDAQGPLLRAAADPAKDQTYMLAALSPDSLSRMRFPLGELTKVQTRAIAAEQGLGVAGKPDSQDLCFLAGTSRARFLERHGDLRDRPGTLTDPDGRFLGRHRGQHHFTVGQRRGLGVHGGEPLYVLAKHGDRVVVGSRAELRTERVQVRGARLHRPAERVDRVKLRYRSRPLAARVSAPQRGRLVLELREPADGATPGQLACLMDGQLIVGWGTIARGYRTE